MHACRSTLEDPTSGTRRLQVGDVLLVQAPPDDLLAIRRESGLELHPIVQYGEQHNGSTNGHGAGHRDASDEAEGRLLQVVVAPDSSLAGRSLGTIDFLRRYRVLVLGLWRKEPLQREELARTRLRGGDVLVLQGEDDALSRLGEDRDFLMLVPFQAEARQTRKELLAGLVMLGTIIVAGTRVLPLSLATVAGATAMVVLQCVTPAQAYRSIDQRMYIFIAGAIPLGTAMAKTGAAKLLAGWMQALTQGWSVVLILFAIYVVVGVLVQFMGSDSATTAIFAPVAIAFAAALGHPPEPFVIAVAIAAVTATFTPMSHHNLLIYAPGGYRFSDYLRVSGPLSLGVGAITAIIAPLLWR